MKIILFLLILTVLAGAAACGKSETKDEVEVSKATTSESDDTEAAATEGIGEAEPEGNTTEETENAGAEVSDIDLSEHRVVASSVAVLIIFGASNTFMTATEATYVGDLVKRAGGENILTGMQGSFIPVDMEFLADKNPEYILFMAHANPEESLEAFKKEFETNEAWQNFDAVKNDKVIALDTGYFGMSANLLASEAMEKLVGYLYTE